MRVLHVAPTVSVGDGTSLAVLAMLRSLGKDPDVELQLLVGKYRGLPLHPALSDEDVATEIVPVFQPFGTRLGVSVGYPGHFRRSLSRLASRADVVHFHGLWLYPTLLGGPTLRRLGTPYVLSLHGSLMLEALKRGRAKKALALALFERKNVLSAAVVLATSTAELDQVRSLRLAVNGSVVPLALDPLALDFFSGRRPLETVLARRERTVLCVSRFHSRKRLVELVRAFAEVARGDPRWHLRILGPDYEGGYRSKVIAAARDSGVANRITVEPPLEGERLWRAYCEADLFVLASTFENFGLVIAEALAAGLPVITTRGAPWSSILTERCGWWIDPYSDGLRAALQEAMSIPPADLYEMGQRGARLIETRFTLRALGERLRAIYRSVGERPDAATARPEGFDRTTSRM